MKLENAISGQPRLDVDGKHTLEPAHGEEIVRSIWIDEQVSTTSLICHAKILTLCRPAPSSQLERTVIFELSARQRPQKHRSYRKQPNQRKRALSKDTSHTERILSEHVRHWEGFQYTSRVGIREFSKSKVL